MGGPTSSRGVWQGEEGLAGGGGRGSGRGEGKRGSGRGRGGWGHFSPAAIYCTTTWCFALKGLRTTTSSEKLGSRHFNRVAKVDVSEHMKTKSRVAVPERVSMRMRHPLTLSTIDSSISILTSIDSFGSQAEKRVSLVRRSERPTTETCGRMLESDWCREDEV